jgi:hypothetical protein
LRKLVFAIVHGSQVFLAPNRYPDSEEEGKREEWGVGWGGGIASRIPSFEITLFGAKGIKLADLKLFLIILDLKASIRARGYASRKSSLSI